VVAVNANGDSTSISVPGTTHGPPDAPTGVQVRAGTLTNNAVTIEWTAPVNNGGTAIQDYTITRKDTSGVTQSTDTALTNFFAYTSLTPGATYTYQVVARNTYSSGVASVSSANVRQHNVPDVPTGLVKTTFSNVNQVVMNWVAPVYTGDVAITGYDVEVETINSGVSSWSTVSSPLIPTATISPLVAGQNYHYRVFAKNVYGRSATSVPLTFKNEYVPSAPSSVQVTAGTITNVGATITWSAASANGATITKYVVTRTNGANVVPVDVMGDATLTYTFTGLTARTTYTI
jgi:hypothetical protein